MNQQIDIRSLIARCCQSNESAWLEFFDLFHGLVAGTVLKVIDHDIDDTVQLVYCNLIDDDYRLLKKFKGTSFFEFLSYLQQIAKNTALNARRQAGRWQRIENIDELLDVLAEREHPESQYLQREISDVIAGAVLELDEKYREIVYLLMQGFKHREIAAMLQLKVDTVSTRIRRAQIKLQESLRELQK